MPIELTWGNDEQTVIIQTFSGKWTWEDFYEYNSHHLPQMMLEVDHTVNIISDFSDGNLPMGGAITHARNVLDNYPDNWGILVVVSDSMFIRSLVDIFCKIFKSSLGENVHSANSLDEARAIIDAQNGSAASS